MINPGTLVRVGQKLGEFTNTRLLEMEASAGLTEVELLDTGQEAVLTSEDVPGEFRGTIQRINRVIDRSSMTVKVYIHTRHPILKDGMYMTAYLKSRPVKNVFSISRDLLTEKNRVYAVKDSILTLVPVKVAAENGSMILVRGLEDGIRILGEPWSEARPGKKIPAVRPGS
jgi:multidrug efflux pump subunit AcrA (membrane-fusion protein)